MSFISEFPLGGLYMLFWCGLKLLVCHVTLLLTGNQ